jgi:hypothetical protein
MLPLVAFITLLMFAAKYSEVCDALPLYVASKSSVTLPEMSMLMTDSCLHASFLMHPKALSIQPYINLLFDRCVGMGQQPSHKFCLDGNFTSGQCCLKALTKFISSIPTSGVP